MSDCSLLIPHILVYAQKETHNPRGLDKSAVPGEQTGAGEQSGSWEAGVLSRYEQGVRNRCLKLCSDSPSTPRWCCAVSDLLVSFCRCHLYFCPRLIMTCRVCEAEFWRGKMSHMPVRSVFSITPADIAYVGKHNGHLSMNWDLFFFNLVSAFFNSCFPKCY